MISIPVPGGKPARAFEVKAAEPTHNYLLVIHEWWGLNDYIQQAAERYARELGNVHVIAIDLYDGKVTADPAEAAKIMGGVKEDRIRAILRAALGYAGPTARIQTLGWCFGGGWSLQAAIMAGSRGTGCVMYYGMPETDATKLKELKAPVLGLFASKDDWITPEIVSDFVRTMKKNGKDIRVNSYTAAHAFANPSNPKYNKEAADAANQLALKFLREHLH
jgi:carboxymethylenebutenolidase